MSTTTAPQVEPAQFWRSARRLYAFYSDLITHLQLQVLPSRELANPIDRSDAATIERVEEWLERVERQVQVPQLRQVLQTHQFADEELLRALVVRHLGIAAIDTPSEDLQDKIDYLLVQYFSMVAPHHPHDSEVTMAEVEEVLRPLVGASQALPPASDLDKIAEAVNQCSSLLDLLDSGLVELGREAKHKVPGGMLPARLVQITRFNYRLRLSFFRLMHADLQAVRGALSELEAIGVSEIDCREAGLGSEEPIASLKNLCRQWRKPFHEAYRAGQSFRQLGLLRNVLTREAVRNWVRRTQVKAPGTLSASETPALLTPDLPPNTTIDPTSADMLAQVMESISEQLFAVKQKQPTATVSFGESKQVLASWEVKAFVRGADPCDPALQAAVAARCLLAYAADRSRRGEKSGIKEALQFAHSQAALIQEQVARAKERGEIDSAVNLAASAKRLIEIVQQVEALKP